MKRWQLLFLLPFYLLSTSGFATVYLHLCGETVAEVAFWRPEGVACCCKKPDKEHTPCCETRIQSTHASDDQLVSLFVYGFAMAIPADVLPGWNLVPILSEGLFTGSATRFRGPPPASARTRRVQIHSLIFYA